MNQYCQKKPGPLAEDGDIPCSEPFLKSAAVVMGDAIFSGEFGDWMKEEWERDHPDELEAYKQRKARFTQCDSCPYRRKGKPKA